MNQIAIIGPTASGKSDLAIAYALKNNAYILSIDSLSIYKEVDIVSAKPSKEELSLVKHFGIDELFIDEYFSVEIFIELYKQAFLTCKQENKNLVIVGGTSFYLKTLLNGLSPVPPVSKEIQRDVLYQLKDIQKAYQKLLKLDPKYMQQISPNDRYRIEKALLIFEATKQVPSQWFQQNPPKPIIKDIDIFEIEVSRDILRQRISERTQKMLQNGLIDEICYLERKYTRLPNPMKSIGIIETLDYLDGKITKKELQELITTHTAQLAKRQETFNRSQFLHVKKKTLQELQKFLLS
ncbi:MAG: tRNA (adenosine(37)-N6)-dimethylallyltransferase MiaA [Epsilonproteobacteria bacterium]|nr:tRNA (adenosine(37)-N6)-dimethylallyltransferase MiaA [Campylobacterota bacterium]